MLRELGTRQEALDDGRAELERNRAQLEAGAEELRAGAPEVERGERLLALAENTRTVSEDGTAAMAVVTFAEEQQAVTAEDKEALQAAVDGVTIDGVQVEYSSEIAQDISQLFGPAEVVGVLIAAVVLLVMLGTLVAAGLPILTALTGVGIGALATLSFSGVVPMTSVTPMLGLMLGLAVGIDYSLFILDRHRRQLLRGVELHESIGLATGTSGNAVVFAGLTVIIALAALNVTGIGFLGLMGTAAWCCSASATTCSPWATRRRPAWACTRSAAAICCWSPARWAPRRRCAWPRPCSSPSPSPPRSSRSSGSGCSRRGPGSGPPARRRTAGSGARAWPPGARC